MGKYQMPLTKLWRKTDWTVLLDFLAGPFISSRQPSLPYFKDVFSSYTFIIWVFCFLPNQKYFLNRTEIDRLHFARKKKKLEVKLFWNAPRLMAEKEHKVPSDVISFLSAVWGCTEA